MAAAAFAMASATACRRTTPRRGAIGGSLAGGGGSKNRKLFFHIAAGAFFALHRSIHPGDEFFKSMTAIFANIFINRHDTLQNQQANSLIIRQ